MRVQKHVIDYWKVTPTAEDDERSAFCVGQTGRQKVSDYTQFTFSTAPFKGTILFLRPQRQGLSLVRCP